MSGYWDEDMDCRIELAEVYRELQAERDALSARLQAAEAALVGMLAHSCVADAGADMKDAADHAAERAARAVLASRQEGES